MPAATLLFYGICLVVRADSQKYHGFIRQVVTKAVFTLGDIFTLLTDNKNNPKITVNTGAAATGQVQPVTDIAERFRIHVRVFKNSFDPALNSFTDRRITAQIADK